jgi:folate-binding protein YgfZ
MLVSVTEGPSECIGAELVGRGCLRVHGSEAKAWLGRLMTSDVAALDPAAAQVGLLLTQQGKILTDALLVDTGDAVLVGTAPDRAPEVEEILSSYLIMEDAELVDESGAHAWFELHGTDAPAIAARVASGHGGSGVRLGAPGPNGAVVVVPSVERAACSRALEREGVSVLDPARWDAWRIRHGIVVFGVDYGLDDRPHEAGIERSAVSWTKGCYLGQEVVCMQDMRGKVKRRLALLRLAGPEPASVNASVEHGGSRVGEVTSATRDAGDTFVIARLKAPFFSEPSELTVGGRAAELVPSPLSPEPAQ